MSKEERKLLVELAAELPLQRDELLQRLEADTRYRETERAIRAAEDKRRRALDINRDTRRSKLRAWFGPLLTIGSILALLWVGWLAAHGGGHLVGLMVWAFLAVLGYLRLPPYGPHCPTKQKQQ